MSATLLSWLRCGCMLLALSLPTTVFAEEATANPRVLLKTDLGEIIIELYPNKAPRTVANFLSYVNDRFYDGLVFHRVIPDFVVQTGGYSFDFVEKPTREPVANESDNGLKNRYGTVAMARHSDPDSATSQFFINMRHNPRLDAKKNKPGYTVFGKVVQGMDVAKLITKEPRGMYRQFAEAPNVPVRVLIAKQL